MADNDAFNADELVGTFEALSAQSRSLESGAAGFARAMSQAFSRAIVDGRRFEDVLKSLVLRMSDLAVRAAFRPLERGIAGGIDSLFQSLLGGGQSNAGGVLQGLFGSATPFADGGVIASPTYFPLGPGRLGLAGEAGPEAILPLARGVDGRLGVAAGGQGGATHVTVNVVAPDPSSFRHSEAYLSGVIARAVARGQRTL